MRLATTTNGVAIVIGQSLLDPAHEALGEDRCAVHWPDIGEVLRSGSEALGQLQTLDAKVRASQPLRRMLETNCAFTPPDTRSLKAPLPSPAVLLCLGRSYARHVAEMRISQQSSQPFPSAFLKSPRCIIGPGDPIELPVSHPSMVDYEGEIALVFARRCFNVAAEEALDYVAGYTLVNEVSARDWNAPPGDPQNWDAIRLGKQFPTFCPMGPFLVTPEDADDPLAMPIETRLNGEMVQQSTTADLLRSFAEVIAHYSQWYEFDAGDVLSTGTPEGVGFTKTPPRFLRSGDVVEVTSKTLGTLSNPVVAAKLQVTS